MGESRSFDGVVCFGGEDWWYHNRGHYDMQMMRELSSRTPVLYVNSLGLRMPSPGEGRMFVRRVARKLGSITRGLVSVRDGFAVLSPISTPRFVRSRWQKRALGWQIRRAAHSLGILRPLAWVLCLPACELLELLGLVGLVYQRTDRFEAFPGVDPRWIRDLDGRLKRGADLSVYCSRHLFEAEKEQCRRAALIDHGVDYDVFSGAGDHPTVPIELAGIPSPRAGFVGAIDAHTFDASLFLDVVTRMPDVRFVLVGSCSLPHGWCTASNVHLLGRRDYEAVPHYMAACDVLLMPRNRSEWIRDCNPIKLKEYLAVGRPVVSTSFDELEHYRDHVTIADGAQAFARAVRQSLASPGSAEDRRKRVRHHTWANKARQVLEELQRAGLEPAG